MKNIQQQPITLPSRAPVMVLPNALLFPHTLLPLYIFEPRYRAMLAWALEHERMFCLALTKPGVFEAASPDDFHAVAGLGLVRACIGREDGTSHLVLQGLARVRFTGFEQERPFRIATMAELPSEMSEEIAAAPLKDKVLELCARLREQGMEMPESLDAQLAGMSDPSVFCDMIAHTILTDPQRRQSLLEETRVGPRLGRLIQHLTTQLAS